MNNFGILFSIDPPASLTISGYEENTHIDAGAVLKLLCVATAGNPLANVTWFKNDKEVSLNLHYNFIAVNNHFSCN